MSDWSEKVASCSSEAQALIQCVEDDLTRNREKLVSLIRENRRLTAEVSRLREANQALQKSFARLADSQMDEPTKRAIDTLSGKHEQGCIASAEQGEIPGQVIPDGSPEPCEHDWMESVPSEVCYTCGERRLPPYLVDKGSRKL
jgi:hypothetical protein